MEKPGIELATPGLQGIALIHYTTAAKKYYMGQFNFSRGGGGASAVTFNIMAITISVK